MNDLEKIKKELEEYKIENHALRLKNEKVKNTVSFRLGNIIISGFKGYREFIFLPYNLYKLRKDIKEIKRQKNNIVKDKSIILSRHNHFIIRDNKISSHVMVKEGDVSINGKIFAEKNEKQNAALLIFKISEMSDKILANKIGVSWSEKVGMYHYLPTDKEASEFSIALKNLPAGKLEVSVRRWHSKHLVKITGELLVKENISYSNNSSESGIIKKYTELYYKKGCQSFIDNLNKDKKLSRIDKSEVIISFMKGLTANERKTLLLLTDELTEYSPHTEQIISLCQHLYGEGCYKEASIIHNHFKIGLDTYKINYANDVIDLLNNSIKIPDLREPVLPGTSNVIKYFIHCSMPHHSNGYATRSHSVMTALNALELNVVGSTRPGYPWDVRFAAEPSQQQTYNIEGINYSHLPGPIQRNLTISEYIEQASRVIESDIISNGAKIIHACSNYLNAFPALFAARRLGLPFIYEVRGFWEITESSNKHGWENSDKYLIDRHLETQLVKSADVVITLTEAMKSEIASRGVDANRIFVAPNAVDVKKFLALPADTLLKKELGLQEELTIGYVGSIVDYEGLDDLITASHQLIQQGYRFNVLIVGDGKALPSLKRLVSKLSLDKYVKFTGRVPHQSVVNYYSIIDITPFPRKSLNVCELVSPLKPFEAMALGKCVIASDVKAIKEFIIEGENGVLFKKGSIDSLKEGLALLLTNTNLRLQLAAKAKDWVTKQRTWFQTGQIFKEAYDYLDNVNNISKARLETLAIKHQAIYHLGQKEYIDVTDKPSTNIIVDGDSNYLLTSQCVLENAKTALVQFSLFPETTKEKYISLGYHWSDKMGAYRYIPFIKNTQYCIPFKTDTNSISAKITINAWGKTSPSPIHYKTIKIEKSFNDKFAAISEISHNHTAKNVAVYGDVNTNLIDGAAIWLISLAKTLARINHVNVFVFLKDKINSSEVIDDAYTYKNIYLIEPEKGPMKTDMVVNAFKNFEEEYGTFDAVIVRGSDVCKALADAGNLDGRLIPYLTDIPQSTSALTTEWKKKIDDIIYSSGHVLCQTDGIAEFFAENFPSAKTSLLPPMVPQYLAGVRENNDIKKILIYAGKFAPEWGIRELFSTYRKLKEAFPQLELHIYGDKIHNPKDDPAFYHEILSQLNSGNGVVWHGRTTRQQVLKALLSADLAWAWRHDSLEQNTKELSTKLLEYGLAKIPVLLNRSPLYENLLGKDFELFACNQQELEQRAHYALLLQNKERTTAPLEDLVRMHSFDHVAINHLQPMLEKFQTRKKRVILLAGHDLKFFTHLEAKFKQQGFIVLVDKWQGHHKHNELKSLSLLERADIIICEWALGNAAWYSENLKSHQTLHIRVHGQEVNLEYFGQMDFDKIDSINFVSKHLLEDGLLKNPFIPREKCHVIPNYVLCEKLDRPKTDGAQFNIGLIGIVPKMKRLDKALDILEALRKRNQRYRLFIKGKKPEEYAWMKNRPEEMSFYEEQYARIEKNPWLKDSVFFEAFGNDMATWYQKIGYVLSTSDHESFHLSIADGAASGAEPKIISWPGSNELYYKGWNFDDILDCVESFSHGINHKNKELVRNFDISNIGDIWINKV